MVVIGRPSFITTPVCAPRVYWDLDIQTNAVIKHRGPSEVLPPHPEVELLRSQLILKLRQHYRELCQQREGEGSTAFPWLYHLGLCGKGGLLGSRLCDSECTAQADCNVHLRAGDQNS